MSSFQQKYEFPTHYDLVSGFVCSIGCGFACLNMLFVMNKIIPSITLIISVIWALAISSLELGIVIPQAVRSIIGAAVGAVFGMISMSLARLIMGDEPSVYYISTLFSFPFCLVLAYANDGVKTPLRTILRGDVGIMSLYLVASFSNRSDEVLTCTWQTICIIAIGSACAVLASVLWRVFSSRFATIVQIRECCDEYANAVRSVLEALLLRMNTGHATDFDFVLENRLGRVEKSSNKLLGAIDFFINGRRTDLCDIVSLMTCKLHASVHCISQLSRIPTDYKVKISDTIVVMSVILRPNAKTVDHGKLDCLCDGLQAQLVQESRALSGDFDGAFACALTHALARLLREFLFVRETLGSSGLSWLRGSESRFELAKKTLTNLHAWLVSIRTEFRVAARFAISLQIGIQLFTFWHITHPYGTGKNLIWAAMPLFFCLLPTTGASLVKGSRRVIGTVVGGLVALLTMLITDDTDNVGFIAQTVFVCFMGKFFARIPKVGYAGVVATMTWLVVSLTFLEKNASLKERASISYYRITYNILGVTAAIVFSVTILPTSSYKDLTSSCSKSISAATKLVVNGLNSFLEKDMLIDSVAAEARANEEVAMTNSVLRYSRVLRKSSASFADIECLVANLILPCSLGKHYSRSVTSQLLQLENRIDWLGSSAVVFHVSARRAHNALSNLGNGDSQEMVTAVHETVLKIEMVERLALQKVGKGVTSTIDPMQLSISDSVSVSLLRIVHDSNECQLTPAYKLSLVHVHAFVSALRIFEEALRAVAEVLITLKSPPSEQSSI